MKFDTPGDYALLPRAFGVELTAATCGGLPIVPDGAPVAVIDVCGPLGAAKDCVPYDMIVMAVQRACATDAATVVLRIDSPGGEVAGCFDAARQIARLIKAAGKQYVVHTSSCLCSAAYALASRADRIIASPSAEVGSIGVIRVGVETSRADAAMGLNFYVLASGARKADGNPHVPLTDDARAAMQAGTDAQAALFFGLVSEGRGIKAGAVEALQAGVFLGDTAKTLGLVDEVAPWDALHSSLIASHTLAKQPPGTGAKVNSKMPGPDDDKPNKDEDATRASLVADSNSDDEKKAKRAKRALAAYDKQDEDDKKDDKSAKAESSDDDTKATLAAVSAQLRSVTAQLDARNKADAAKSEADAKAQAAADRAAFFATRPDLGAETLATFADLPLDKVKAIVAKIPVVGNPLAPASVAAAATRTATSSDPYSLPAAEALAARPNAALDQQLGWSQGKNLGVRQTGVVLEIGVPTPGVK